MKVLVFGADGFEDLELFYPLHRLKEEGIDARVVSVSRGTVEGKHGYHVEADLSFDEVDPDEYDALVISGGKGPEIMRLNEYALDIVKHFMTEEKPVAAICHGPQLLISARVLDGRKATCWPGIRDDLIVAGADYRDNEVVVDDNLVTSRHPGDLFAFGRELLGLIKG
ncbi:type 1 glutamine amidotransferase domain-containing protein [Methanohalophilus portucalensis]|uniref:PfpI peptidase n=2 Tax=Methanohalophilus portucalensis TaxID=39664 RepID=A0A1L9C6F5_9EURY|nr:type 1 glutamine amidotransferase domain-containing protein [Methanohalophilus portucalensis]ATU08605.1 peptidase [Methanohalophilus portucalensis]OJH49978.1 PfpI peptidase [Methanohalophilus portucalensis FDF-1]RNI13222.1 type 1 glutamine amidotransferase [Methanohalophilus portucalensis FDF-1]SMH32420.1 PfpI peptidase. Cysteine peptidase. MEROPS family C56 [Methanohalophilus portucalensis FDF-1]